MKFSIASYSFHRLLRDGKQDVFKYITDCKDLGCALLDVWNGHLAPLVAEDEAFKAGADALQTTFSSAGLDYVARVAASAEVAGMPFGCVAVDGAHIYEPTLEARQANRATAYRWLTIAERLGAAQMRIDSGGTEDMPEEQFAIIVDGLRDVVKRGSDLGIEILIENHWGASRVAENVVKMLDAVDGLKLLFDTNNFVKDQLEKSWELCTPYARSVHIKTFEFDDSGSDPSVDIPKAIRLLLAHKYDGCWGVESVPRDGDEYGAAKKTMALIQRTVEAAS